MPVVLGNEATLKRGLPPNHLCPLDIDKAGAIGISSGQLTCQTATTVRLYLIFLPSPTPIPHFTFRTTVSLELLWRIRNIYSPSEKQSQVKLQGVPRNLISVSGTRRNWRASLKPTTAWVMLVRERSQSLLAGWVSDTSYRLCRRLNHGVTCSFQTFPLGFSSELFCIVHVTIESQILFGITVDFFKRVPFFLCNILLVHFFCSLNTTSDILALAVRWDWWNYLCTGFSSTSLFQLQYIL